MSTKYPTLLSPAKIGSVEIRNRTIMAAMGMSQSDNGFVNKATINHYAARAKGGVGAIIVEVTCVDTPLGLNTNGMLVIDDDKYIPGMTDLAAAIHDGGAKAFLQISHTGRGARRAIIGDQPVGPSAVAMPYSYMMGLSNETPRALTIEEIKAIEEKYAQAALRAKKAGFDGVEIHSVGYYLGQQFLSKTANIRTDEYGGSRANRCRFHLNIIKRIRELCGEDFAILVKLSVVEQGPDGGISIPDGIYYAKRFQPLQPYLERQLELTGVNVHLGQKVSKEDILAMDADAVVCATGAESVTLPLDGAERTVSAKDVLLGKETGKNVVVIGGGSTGCETAELLAMDRKNVTVLELTDTLAGNTGKTAQTVLMGHLKGYGAKLLTECRAEKITEDSVVYTDKEGASHTLKADTVVMAVGERPDPSLYESLKGEVKELYNIGDSNGGGILPNAVYEGYTVGNQL